MKRSSDIDETENGNNYTYHPWSGSNEPNSSGWNKYYEEEAFLATINGSKEWNDTPNFYSNKSLNKDGYEANEKFRAKGYFIEYGDLEEGANSWINNGEIAAADIELKAQWDLSTYKVEHYQQNITGDGYTLIDTEELEGTTDTIATAAPKNYTGFTENTAHGERIAKGTITPDESLVLKLYYDRDEITVTFKDHNGDELKSQTVLYQGTATPPGDPVREGYTFDGWVGNYENVTKDEIVTAAYQINQYNITFDSNGGSLVAIITQDYGTDIKAPENPTRPGYTFDGWDPEIPGTMGAEDITLKAQWDLNHYTIQYELEGGVYDEDAPKNYTIEDETIELGTPTRSGYLFDGWYDVQTEGDNVTEILSGSTGNLTLYARWSARTDISYKVEHYQQNITGDGYTLIDTEELEGTTDTIATAAPKNYTGFTENTAHGERIAEGTITSDESLVLKLYYDRDKITVTFKDHNGDELKSQTVLYQGTATPPGDPVREGYTFDGWEGNFTKVVNNQIIKATYKINSYLLQFNSGGGSKVADLAVEYGKKIDRPKNPTKLNHTFSGWYKESDLEKPWDFRTETMPARDITLYAKWIETPIAPVLLEKTDTSIKIGTHHKGSIEYRINGGSWQKSGLFENLTEETEYRFEARVAATAKDAPSDPSKSIIVKTNKTFIPAENVSIKGLDGVSFDSETIISITNETEMLQKEEHTGQKANILLKDEGKEIAELYDIRLILNNQRIQPNGRIRISIKLPNDLLEVAEQLEIYYIDDDSGKYQVMPHRIEDDTIIFETDHLSYYAIIAPLQASEEVEIEKSVDSNNIPPYGAILGALLIIIFILFSRKSKKNRESNEQSN